MKKGSKAYKTSSVKLCSTEFKQSDWLKKSSNQSDCLKHNFLLEISQSNEESEIK